MNNIHEETTRLIQETLRERGVEALDQEFIINLFDSAMKVLEMDSSASIEEMDRIRNELSTTLFSSYHLLMMLRQQTAELDALRHLSLHLSSSLDLSTILKTVVGNTMELLPDVRTVHIFLYDEEKDKLEFGAALDEDGLKSKSFSEPRQNGLTYTVAREGKMLTVPDMQEHFIYSNAPKDWHGSIIGMPLKIAEKVVGVMNVSRSTEGLFTAADMRFLALLAEQAAVAISNAHTHARISKAANSDTLTGLPNRRALDEHLEEELQSAYRTGHTFTTVMMDLDGFKNVNDKYGHTIGDKVLRVLFNYLAQGLRASDFLARYGGDELTLILHQGDVSVAQQVTEKMKRKLEQFVYTLPDGEKLNIGMSGGIALFPVHGQTASELLRAADSALYRAKKHTRGTFLVARPKTGELRAG